MLIPWQASVSHDGRSDDMEEKLKRIKGFEDYFISDLGNVYSERLRGWETKHRLRRLKAKNPGDPSKYLNIILCRDGEQVPKSIHRLVAEHFVDGYFDGAVVNHIDGNNRNNRADNLEWVTTKVNIHKSYDTSGKDQRRNFKIWKLFDNEHQQIGEFRSHFDLEEFVKSSGINASPTMLTKHGRSNGYTVIKS